MCDLLDVSHDHGGIRHGDDPPEQVRDDEEEEK